MKHVSFLFLDNGKKVPTFTLAGYSRHTNIERKFMPHMATINPKRSWEHTKNKVSLKRYSVPETPSMVDENLHDRRLQLAASSLHPVRILLMPLK